MKPPSDDVELAREWAGFYRGIGWNPLPMCRDHKRPAMKSYSRERDEGLPEGLLDSWWTPNIQVPTGSRWGLCVLDLDGRAAKAIYASWAADRPVPATWEAAHGPDGQHVYFSLPPWASPLPHRRLIWARWDEASGDWKKHEMIELLGERNLVVAPPSLHPNTGSRYRFLPGFGPAEIPMPAPAPAWLLAMPALEKPRKPFDPPLLPLPRRNPHAARGAHYDHRVVLDAVGDPRPVATSWGLRIASRDWNASGWVKCHRAAVPDENPSAALSKGGGYWEAGADRVINLFGLGVLLGRYVDWVDCMNDLGERFHAPSEVRHDG